MLFPLIYNSCSISNLNFTYQVIGILVLSFLGRPLLCSGLPVQGISLGAALSTIYNAQLELESAACKTVSLTPVLSLQLIVINFVKV